MQRFGSRVCRALVFAGIVGGLASALSAAEVPLGSLDLSKLQQGWGKPQVDRSITEKPLSIGGTTFAHGVGSHAAGRLWIAVNGATRFRAWVGVDDGAGQRGTVVFQIVGDGRKLFDSGTLRGGQSAKQVDLDLTGIRHLVLVSTPAGDDINYDHADWADAAFVYQGAAPVAIDRPQEERVLLTPPAPPAPRIGAPRVYGVRPGRPVLFRVPATGRRPMRFTAEGLPDGLLLEGESGILRGPAPSQPGEYRIALRAENAAGTDEKTLRLIVGNTIALTPPMGWNHWYTYYNRVSDDLFRVAADAMIETGMADYGYAYVNLDDCWMVKPGSGDPKLGGEPRDAQGALRGNANFPDMKGLADYIHARGLKAGLYTSPGPRTCAGYEGSYQHEEIDARQFAAWGFDFLKYDWCSYTRVSGGDSLEHLQAPYRKMGAILPTLERDIVFNLCQYGMGDVWKWGGEVGGHSWRTAGDLGFELGRFFEVGLRNAEHAEHARPGCWNDPDYLLIGVVGDATNIDAPPKATSLSPNEQYAYMSLWAISAAPLFYSGDIVRMDPFTLNILCNAEVIEMNQDPLGVQARVVARDEDHFVMAKPLEDGSLAVGLFNRSDFPLSLSADWKTLGCEGPQAVRDLWRQRDLPEATGKLAAEVPARGVVLVRLKKATPRP